jgi:hypothetical protein
MMHEQVKVLWVQTAEPSEADAASHYNVCVREFFHSFLAPEGWISYNYEQKVAQPREDGYGQ